MTSILERGRRLASAVAIVALSALASAQKTPEVKARFDPGVVKLGGTAHLFVEVENAQTGDIPALPQVAGLRFGAIGPYGTSSYTEIVNGRVSSRHSITWRIPVQPLEKGEITVPPFRVRADGRELSTRELRLRVVEDLKGEELGLLEIDAPKEVWQGQPFVVEIRLGFEAGIQGRLNYYNLALPWLGELGGLVELDAPPIGTGKSAGKILLNSRHELEVEGHGVRKVGDSSFLELRVRKRFVATRSGALTFPTSHFEFGRKQDGLTSIFNRGGEEFVYYKRSPAFDVVVKPVPEEGRPLDWSGAVGHVEVGTIADRRDVVAGDSIKLTVEWTGDANLEFFDAPDPTRLDAFDSFRVYGTQDRKTWDRRSVTYDLAPIDPGVTEIPALPLSVFDTTTGRYDVVSTKPIPIRVRPLEGATGIAAATPGGGTTVDLRDIQTRVEGGGGIAASLAPSGRALAGLALAIVAGWLALRAWVRRRGDPDAPRARARRRARRDLENALRHARTPSEQARAVHAFLAARTGETPEAWTGRDPVRWSRAHTEDEPKLEPSAAQALAQLFAKLDAAIWGGGSGGKVEDREVLALADRVSAGGL
jgi:hypothetical protein